jgi:hypothetical protein
MRLQRILSETYRPPACKNMLLWMIRTASFGLRKIAAKQPRLRLG